MSQDSGISAKAFAIISRLVSSKGFLIFVFAWFIFQALYISFATQHGVPPDERLHSDLINFLTSRGWLPFLDSQESHYYLGELTRTPFYLYHYLLSLPFHFFRDAQYEVIFLRLINIGLGVASLYFVQRLALQLKVSAMVKNLSLFMLANTLMFIFLSASINYDNLIILLTLVTFNLLLGLLKKVRFSNLMLLLIVLVAGLLVKEAFIPVAVGTIAALFITHVKHFRQFWDDFISSFKQQKWLNLILVGLLLVVIGLFSERYIYNLIKYRDYSPACDQIHAVEQCEENFIYKRTKIFESNTGRGEVRIENLNYLTQWSLIIQERTHGMLGHRPAAKATVAINAWSQIFFAIGIIALARGASSKDLKFNILLGITAFYVIALLFWSLKTYKITGYIDLGVQGRYIFPVLPVIYLAWNHYILKLLSRNFLKSTFIALSLIIFMTAGLPSYIYTTTPSWHSSRLLEVNKKIKSFMIEVRELPLIESIR